MDVGFLTLLFNISFSLQKKFFFALFNTVYVYVYMYVYVEWGSVFRSERIACVIDIWGKVFVYVYMLSEVAEDLENEGRHKGAGNYKTEIF